MQAAVRAVFLAAILGLLSSAAQVRLRSILKRRRLLIWILPPALAAAFAGAALIVNAFSLPLTLLVLAYAALPVACICLLPPSLDLIAVLSLWLPIEFAAGAALVPRPAQGIQHSVAYGIAILLGLTIFLGYRNLDGMKYNLPRRKSDFWLPLAAFAVAAPILILVGIPISFISPPHLPVPSAGRMAAAVGLIFVGTALPEEILFRALIQNLLMQRFGATERTLILASVVFGAAHLDNGPQPLPNWRYMILASIAGYAYGKVFQKANTVLSSAALHMLVDWTKHFFF